MINLSHSILHVCSFVNVSCMACQMTAGRCHTLLSPVTEESGEEGTNSEVSSPPVCRSPSPITHTEATISKVSVFFLLFSMVSAKIHILVKFVVFNELSSFP